MTILSFQSSVAHGHVGNSAAAFALQRLGLDLARLDTVHFSNHPGHGGFTGRVVPPEDLARLADGLEALGLPGRLDGVLSGYLGCAGAAPVLARLVGAMRRGNPRGLYLCDPVMGDDGTGLYVASDIVETFRHHLLPLADIITPNRFELEVLARRPVTGLEQARGGARDLLAQGPRMVVVTSLDLAAGSLSCLLETTEGGWLVTTPHIRFPIAPNGAGDLLSALLLGHLAGGHAAPQALELAVSAVHGVLAETRRQDRRELALAGAQDQLVAPGRMFRAEKL